MISSARTVITAPADNATARDLGTAMSFAVGPSLSDTD
jgi:hypothetical protein